jgi:hypothetical protein
MKVVTVLPAESVSVPRMLPMKAAVPIRSSRIRTASESRSTAAVRPLRRIEVATAPFRYWSGRMVRTSRLSPTVTPVVVSTPSTGTVPPLAATTSRAQYSPSGNRAGGRARIRTVWRSFGPRSILFGNASTQPDALGMAGSGRSTVFRVNAPTESVTGYPKNVERVTSVGSSPGL